MPNNYTEGDYLGQDSTEKLVSLILDQIRYMKGFCLSTGFLTAARHTQLPTAATDNWAAHGTMISVPETVYLDQPCSFKILLADFPPPAFGTANLIVSVYRYTGNSSCGLVCNSDMVEVNNSGWLEIPVVQVAESVIEPDSEYYLVIFYNLENLTTYGNLGVTAEDQPYGAFITSDLGELDAIPLTLDISVASPIGAFGKLFSVSNSASR